MNRPQRQSAIIDYLRPSAQPKPESDHGIELIKEGLEILIANADITALLQVVGHANCAVQGLIKKAAIAAKKSA